MTAESELSPGTPLGPYTLARVLGTGASATVYAARDAAGREVAVKVRRALGTRADGLDSEMDRRFLREFESMRLLRVKGVVQVHEAGVDGRLLWFSMDLVEGVPFHEAFTGPMSGRIDRLRTLGAELLRILAALHEAGFVHRDIKPTNVLVDRQDRVTVLDFGIGRYFGDHDTLSHTGEVLGTVPYMAPEQVSGLPCDAKVDAFAAGLCLWEAMAGKRPRPSSAVGWIPRICLERLPSLAATFPDVPRGVSAVVDRLLRVDPVERSSAREAMTELLATRSDPAGPEWPEPPWVETDPAFGALDGLLGAAEHPATWVVEGPAGAGKRRVAEQVHRQGLLQGVWTLHLRCRVHRVASPFLDLVEQLARVLDDATLTRVVGPSSLALRQSWPHLVLPKPPADGSESGLTEAVAGVVTRLARTRPVVLVVRDVEQVDPVTARVLLALAERRQRDLGLLILHEPRWATPESTELVERLRSDHAAGYWSLGPLAAPMAAAVARAVAPRATLAVERPALALAAVAAGWSALGRWRKEPFAPPDAALAPLVAGPRRIPAAVAQQVLGRATGPGLRVADDGVGPDGATVAALLGAGLADRRAAATRLATAMEAVLGDRPEVSPSLATAWLLAGDRARAFAPAARAAVFEEQFERYAAAREWLLLLDTLPASRRDPHDDFELAWVQARVALHTDVDGGSERAFVIVERLARTAEQEVRVRLLRAEFDLHAGSVRSALVSALRIASSPGVRPQVQVQALLVAVRCRIVGRQVPEAQRELGRAEVVLQDHAHPALQVRVSNARAELALLQDDLLWCRALCQKNIRVASQTRHLHALAEASWRLSLVLRVLGRRREAEHQIRTAADAALATGDLRIRADAGLALAALLCERGDALPARVLLDETIRSIRALSLDHLLPLALRVALQIATLTGNAADGDLALASIREAADADPETAAVMVQWWRTHGDADRALSVAAPAAVSDRSFGHLRWALEVARTRMAAGRDAAAAALAGQVAEQAASLGFAELEVLARLVVGVCSAVDDATWAGLQERAVGSMWCDVFLGALEMDARRLSRTAPALAEARWRALLVRSRELGHRPGVEEATGWLGGA